MESLDGWMGDAKMASKIRIMIKLVLTNWEEGRRHRPLTTNRDEAAEVFEAPEAMGW